MLSSLIIIGAIIKYGWVFLLGIVLFGVVYGLVKG